MKTELPLGVVNAVPASQIVAGTASPERALSLPEGSLTQEQKDKLMSSDQPCAAGGFQQEDKLLISIVRIGGFD